MATGLVTLTGVERTFRPEEIIVSKTDTTGRITYANEVFQRVSGYREHELLGKPHNLIRHPQMPRCVFKLLWDTIGSGREIFAYVLNRARNGDEYWVLAHVTPTFDARGKIVSYHSNRRAPRREATSQAAALYAQLLAEEDRHADRREAIDASTRMLLDTLDRIGKPYDEFVFSL